MIQGVNFLQSGTTELVHFHFCAMSTTSVAVLLISEFEAHLSLSNFLTWT